MCRKFHVVFKYLVLCFQGLTPPVLYQYSELLHDAQHMCVCVCVYSNACACLNIQSQSHPRIHVVVCTHALHRQSRRPSLWNNTNSLGRLWCETEKKGNFYFQLGRFFNESWKRVIEFSKLIAIDREWGVIRVEIPTLGNLIRVPSKLRFQSCYSYTHTFPTLHTTLTLSSM